MKRRERRPRLPHFAGEALPLPIGHPHMDSADRIGRVGRLDADENPGARRRDGQLRPVDSVGPGGRGENAGVEAEAHRSLPLPLGVVGAAGVAADVAEEERGSLVAELPAVFGPGLEAGDLPLGVHRERMGVTDIPEPRATCHVDRLSDPRPRALKRVGEGPGGRPIDDILEIHPHLHRRGGEHRPRFEPLAPLPSFPPTDRPPPAPESRGAFCTTHRCRIEQSTERAADAHGRLPLQRRPGFKRGWPRQRDCNPRPDSDPKPPWAPPVQIACQRSSRSLHPAVGVEEGEVIPAPFIPLKNGLRWMPQGMAWPFESATPPAPSPPLRTFPGRTLDKN